MSVVIDQDACTGCGACVDSCPVEALELTGSSCTVDADSCTECQACIDECPVEAISI